MIRCTLLLVLVAFAAPRTSSPAQTVDVPPVAAEVTVAFRQGGAEWERMRERVRSDARLARFVVDNMFAQLVASFSAADLGRPERRLGPFERAQAELVALAEHSTPLLCEMLDATISDDVVAWLAADTLGRIGPSAAAPVADKLRSADAATRRRAIGALAAMRPPAEQPLTTGTWAGRRPQEILAHFVRRDDDAQVRGSAAEALGSIAAGAEGKEPARQALVAALGDEDPLVWAAAARGLGALGDVRAVPDLADGLARAVDAGRLGELRAMQAALERLSGGRGPAGQGPAAWKSWYEASRSSPASR